MPAMPKDRPKRLRRAREARDSLPDLPPREVRATILPTEPAPDHRLALSSDGKTFRDIPYDDFFPTVEEYAHMDAESLFVALCDFALTIKHLRAKVNDE